MCPKWRCWDPWVAQRFGACLWPRARSWRPGIESHVGLPVHGACFSLCLCLCLSLSLCDYHKKKLKTKNKKKKQSGDATVVFLSRILEFENPHITSNTKGTGCEFELWDCGGDPKFESCWPALMKDSHGVVIVFNADIPSHLKEIEMWYSCFVQQQFLQDTQCLLIAHHKPGSGSDKGNPSLPTPLNKLKLVHSNLEDDPEDIRLEFIKYLKSIINSVSESRDREEMSIIT
uniref:Intraflagellar transport protein 22 homolog n=1 Tax=Canis lupus familiaris TaxID=9615 RepID=A0A8C0YUX8_CANLF